MCASMVDIQSAAAEIRRGKKRKIERNYRMKIYMVSLLHRATINIVQAIEYLISVGPTLYIFYALTFSWSWTTVPIG